MSKNKYGVYLDYQAETVAELGQSYAVVRIAACDDGLFRFSTMLSYSHGGFNGPIMDLDEGYPSFEKARDAGIDELLKRWPSGWESDPESVHRELRVMREQLEELQRQPLLL